MFNIGGGEFLVIALLALIVLGPQRLPDAARQVGKTMGELRRLSTGFQNELKDAIDITDRAPTTAPPRDVLAEAAPDPAPAALPAAEAPRPRRRSPLVAAPDSTTTPPRNKGS
jgi:sec-independent protein translocase protein TatB